MERKNANYLAMFLKDLLDLKPKNTRDDDNKRLIFQQDGAIFHTYLAIINYFNDHEIEVLN